MKIFCSVLLASILFLGCPLVASAQLLSQEDSNGNKAMRSLESLRDLDYQTWQVVAYSDSGMQNQIVLRIVGYPGSLRLNHPTDLKVESGIKEWFLEDITLQNQQLVEDSRQAAAEFNLAPLLSDLKNNRPLRLFLPGAFNELPIPPYIVSEWRSVNTENLIDDPT